jgi:ferritin-like metal-binding protein YciE
MKLASLHDLYISELKDIYSAETQIRQALPKMAKAASNEKLRAAFTSHLDETHEHIKRLEQLLEQLGASPGGKKCLAMEGLIKEGAEAISADAEPAVRDVALVAAAQRVEHYEIAAYGCVRTFAKELDYKDAAQVLQQTLNEDGAADKKLTALAEGGINAQAAAEPAEA